VRRPQLRNAECGMRTGRSAAPLCRSREPHAAGRKLGIALAALVASLGMASLRAADWTWELTNERYRQLNVFERAQYDKAARLLKEGNPQAAASEFEKFKIQFPDSAALAYVLFMRGYCLQQAKTRNQAIKTYNEVLDYFADDVADAAPAKYFIGLAHLENGDTRQGLATMKEMLANEAYAKHPLAAGALSRLAENHWKNKETEQAVKLWKQAVADFAKTSHTEASQARDNLIVHYIKSKDYAGYDAWLLTAENRDDPKHRVWMAQQVIDKAHHHIFPSNSGHYTAFEREERAAAMKACFEYYKAQKPWYDKAQQTWEYLTRAISFLSQHYGDKTERDKAVDEMVALIRQIKDKADAHGKYAWLVDRLREANDLPRARYVIGLIADPPYAGYKEAELLVHENKDAQAVAQLEQVEKMGNAYWTGQAQERRAWIYKDRLQNYEAAIKIYREINKPPGTLWAIQECFIRWGKLDDAINTLSEIENSFPDEASKAAWHKAHYYHQANQSKKAIAQARKILKVYKTSQEASKAHQMLEGYGVATGGGVFEEE